MLKFTMTVNAAESSGGWCLSGWVSSPSRGKMLCPAQGELFTWRRAVFIAYYILFI